MTTDSELLREIVLWMRFQNRQALRGVLTEVLANESDRIIFELTDGRKSQPEIAKAAGVSQPTISLKWKSWRALGIVYEIEPGRCRHLTDLRSVGIEPPTMKKGATEGE
jgi:hypothetical protein